MKSLVTRGAAAMGLAAALLIAGCGGGGSSPASQAWAEVCTPDGVKNFTRTYLEEVYLWYREIPVVDPALFSNIGSYFHALLTPALDPNGQRKDRFSFIVTAADADSLLTGAATTYGVQWEPDAQGRQRAAFVEAGSPAEAAGLARGAELVQVTTSGTPDWFPNGPAQISFIYRSAPGQATASATLTSAALQEDPLPLVTTLVSTAGHKVAYLLFNAHTSGAQDKLIAAMAGLQQAGVSDLVLDIRYNRGGFLYTAESVSSMLTGPQADGKVFERLQFNDKRQADTDASVIDFSGVVQVSETTYAAGTPLPRLGLPRVFLLTTGNTCSASESIINSLRGVGVEVILIGSTTCGKPYGFSRRDNCGLSYFPIEFQGVNEQGFGDYAAGFTPTCAAADDFDHALGDSGEGMLATALKFVDTGSCPPPVARAQAAVRAQMSPVPQDFSGSRWRQPGKLILTPRP
ncbi:MAG TPA: S41 family peptidase [Ramlibacter sp.]|nr:S41 family peptidase [Ramlibacter sp.]